MELVGMVHHPHVEKLNSKAGGRLLPAFNLKKVKMKYFKMVLFWVFIYISGVFANSYIISKNFKINSAYDNQSKQVLQTFATLSYFSTPLVVFACWDSNREWCNPN
jgi:hypothetical protein